MKKLKNSVKMIIISAVTIICALAVVLGCVFGLKKDDNVSGFSLAQQQLANEIVSNSSYIETDLMSVAPYSDYCNYDKVKAVGKNYFIFEDEFLNENFVVYKKNSDGSITTKLLTNRVSDEIDNNEQNAFVLKDAASYSIAAYNDEYVVIVSEYGDKTSHTYDENVYSVVYFGDFDNIVEIYSFDTRGLNVYMFNDFVLKDKYFAFSVYYNLDYSDTYPVADLDIYFYKLSKEKINVDNIEGEFKLSGVKYGVSYNTQFEFYNDSFYCSNIDCLKIVYLSENDFEIFEKEVVLDNEKTLVKTDYDVSFLTNGKYLIDCKNYVFDESEITLTTVRTNDVSINHIYNIFDFTTKTPTEKTFKLDEGYALATTANQSNTKLTTSFYIKQQKVNEQQEPIAKFLISYYDSNCQKIISFESLNEDNPLSFSESTVYDEYIIYAGTSTFLTNKRLLKVDNNKISLVYDFTKIGNYSLSGNVNSSIFSISDNSKIGLMDIDGNVVVKPNDLIDNIIPTVVDERTVATDGNKYYLKNLKTGQNNVIENFASDYGDFVLLIKQGADVYLTESEGKYTLNRFDGSAVLSDFDSFNFLNLETEAAVELVKGTEVYFVKFNELKYSEKQIESKIAYTFSAYNKPSGNVGNNKTTGASQYLKTSHLKKRGDESIANITCDKGWDPWFNVTMFNSRYLNNFSCDLTGGHVGSIDCVLKIFGTVFNNDGTVAAAYTGNNIKTGVTVEYMEDGNLKYSCQLSFWNLVWYGEHLPEDSSKYTVGTSVKYHYYKFYYQSNDYRNETNYPYYSNSWTSDDSFAMANKSVTITLPSVTINYATLDSWYLDNEYRMHTDIPTTMHVTTLGGGKVGKPGDSYTIEKNNYFTTYFYAKFTADTYEERYTANFDTEQQDKSYNISYLSETHTIFNPFTRTGYTFKYWNTAADESGDTYNEDVDYTFDFVGGVTFYAIWQPNTYSIIYDYDGGQAGPNAPTEATFDEWFHVSNPTKVGYTFKSWYVGATINGTNYYMSNGIEKSFGKTSPQADYKCNTNVIGIMLQSYSYLYFKNLKDGTDDVPVGFKASWTANTYSITYDYAGGQASGTMPTSATYDNWFNVPAPKKTGYTFQGWSIRGMTTNQDHYYGTSTTNYLNNKTSTYNAGSTYLYFKNLRSLYGAVTFAARWSANTYKIIYDLDGGTLADAPTEATFDEWFYVPSPTKIGYTFKSWDIGAAINGTQYNMSTGIEKYLGVTSPQEDRKLATNVVGLKAASIYSYYKNLKTGTNNIPVGFKANWTANKYRINYVANGGTLADGNPTLVSFNSWFKVENPVEAPFGWYFNGWTISGMSSNCTHYYGTSTTSYNTGKETSKDINSSETNYFKDLSSVNGATVTFSARYLPYSYMLNYDLKGGNFNGQLAPNEVDFDSWFIVPAPVREGYTFTGWSFTGLNDEVEHSYRSGSEETKFQSNNGRYVDSENVNYDTLVLASEFKNFDVNSDAVKFIANWKANPYIITYHYMPGNFNTSSVDVNINTLNNAGNMSLTKTQNVEYDADFTTFKASLTAAGSNEIPIPNGVKVLMWVINTSGSTYSSSTKLVSWNSDYSVATPVSGAKYNFNTEVNYKYARNIHVYATYEYIDIGLVYRIAPKDGVKNDVSNYYVWESEYVKYNMLHTLKTIDDENFRGWMISANNYDCGTLTQNSVTSYMYNGVNYTALGGTEIWWLFSNTNAYNYDDPIYHAYAVYYDVDVSARHTVTIENYSIRNIPTLDNYGFALNETGYFESQNTGVNNSYALAEIAFYATAGTEAKFNFISFAETFDFAVFGSLDKTLCLSNSDEKEYKLKTNSSANNIATEQTITYPITTTGTHFIQIKFRKDGSFNKNNDSLQFKFSLSMPKSTIDVFYNQAYGVLPASSLSSDYKLESYSLSQLGSDKITNSTLNTIDADHTIYPNYSYNGYYVLFDGDTTSYKRYKFSENVTLSTKTNIGYNRLSYVASDLIKGVKIADIPLSEVQVNNLIDYEGVVHIESNYEPIQYSVKFEFIGGYLLSGVTDGYTIDCKYGETYNIDTPLKDDNKFVGWNIYRGDVLILTNYTEITFNNLTTTDGDAITLRANWKSINGKYTVKNMAGVLGSSQDFVLKGGYYISEIESGSVNSIAKIEFDAEEGDSVVVDIKSEGTGFWYISEMDINVDYYDSYIYDSSSFNSNINEVYNVNYSVGATGHHVIVIWCEINIGTMMFDVSISHTDNGEIEKVGNQYGFELTIDGYYESQNFGIDDSYALTKLKFYAKAGDVVYISYILSSESPDYAKFSYIDKGLSDFESETTEEFYDSEYASISCDDYENPLEQILEYTVEETGLHFIYIAYIKDGSISYGHDSLRFKINSYGNTFNFYLDNADIEDSDEIDNVGWQGYYDLPADDKWLQKNRFTTCKEGYFDQYSAGRKVAYGRLWFLKPAKTEIQAQVYVEAASSTYIYIAYPNEKLNVLSSGISSNYMWYKNTGHFNFNISEGSGDMCDGWNYIEIAVFESGAYDIPNCIIGIDNVNLKYTPSSSGIDIPSENVNVYTQNIKVGNATSDGDTVNEGFTNEYGGYYTNCVNQDSSYSLARVDFTITTPSSLLFSYWGHSDDYDNDYAIFSKINQRLLTSNSIDNENCIYFTTKGMALTRESRMLWYKDLEPGRYTVYVKFITDATKYGGQEFMFKPFIISSVSNSYYNSNGYWNNPFTDSNEIINSLDEPTPSVLQPEEYGVISANNTQENNTNFNGIYYAKLTYYVVEDNNGETVPLCVENLSGNNFYISDNIPFYVNGGSVENTPSRFGILADYDGLELDYLTGHTKLVWNDYRAPGKHTLYILFDSNYYGSNCGFILYPNPRAAE